MNSSPEQDALNGLLELRALVDELLSAKTDDIRQEVTAALKTWLRLHCATCGMLVDEYLRKRDVRYCMSCAFPPPELDEVPSTVLAGDVPF